MPQIADSERVTTSPATTNGTTAQRLLRCPKHMLHGPCGGVEGDQCEVPGYACPWGAAFVKATELGKGTDHLVARLDLGLDRREAVAELTGGV